FVGGTLKVSGAGRRRRSGPHTASLGRSEVLVALPVEAKLVELLLLDHVCFEVAGECVDPLLGPVWAARDGPLLAHAFDQPVFDQPTEDFPDGGALDDADQVSLDPALACLEAVGRITARAGEHQAIDLLRL